MQVQPTRLVVMSVVTGLVAGLLSGLFGVGGGIVMVPALVYLVGMDQKRAHGTSLAAVAALALSGGASYALAGEIDWAVAGLLAVGSTFGAWFGTKLLGRAEPRVTQALFVVMLLGTALRMAIGDSATGADHALTLKVAALLVIGGAATGVIAGLLGVGGGAVLVPMMIVGLGMSNVMAKGTSLVVIIVSAVVGTVGNRRHSNIDPKVAVIVGTSGVVSSFLGGQVSLGLPERLADLMFAGLLAAVGAHMGRDLYRSRGNAGGIVVDDRQNPDAGSAAG